MTQGNPRLTRIFGTTQKVQMEYKFQKLDEARNEICKLKEKRCKLLKLLDLLNANDIRI